MKSSNKRLGNQLHEMRTKLAKIRQKSRKSYIKVSPRKAKSGPGARFDVGMANMEDSV